MVFPYGWYPVDLAPSTPLLTSLDQPPSQGLESVKVMDFL